ncbi:hypothetical protein FRC04_008231 [Tulasnella sp. 424]|nr:hypothetical protein FRC04_008231 [Tulasnella sp. 424]KAG8974507.1 hypothetical protein FRC05_007306 [Tulasnella sp. 425]
MRTMDSDDIEYEDEFVDAQAELPPVLDPQVEKEIQLVLAGSTIVKSYEGTSQYSQRGPSACGLASFNAVRTVLEKERHGTNGADLVREMMSRRFIEDATAICAAWTSSAHLEVDDIYQFPLFSGALRLVNTDFRQANYAEFGKLLRRIELAAGNTRGGSAAAIITKPPEILAVFAIATGHTEPIGSPFIYAVFDSHSRPDLHPNGAAFSFFGKAKVAAEYLSNLLSFDTAILNDEHLHWQTQLLSQYSAHVFVAQETPPPSKMEMEIELFRANITALESKSALAEMKTNMTELQAKFARSTAENFRLKDEVRMLNSQVESMRVALQETNRDRDEAFARLIQLEEERGEEQEPKPWKGKGKERALGPSEDRQESGSSMPFKPPSTFRELRDNPTSWSDSKPSLPSISGAIGLVGKFFGGTSPAENPSRPSGGYDRDHDRSNRHRDPQNRSRERQQDKEKRPDDRHSKAHPTQRSPEADKDFDDDRKLAQKLQHQENVEQEVAESQMQANTVLRDAHIARQLQQQWDDENDTVRAEHFTLLATMQKTFECPICMEKCPEDGLARLEGCEHQFCRECLKGHIESCLEERRFPVPCPLCMTDEKREDKDCGGLTLETMENLGISQDKYDIWLNFEVAKYSILLDCPKCRQSVLVDKEDHASASILICPVPKCGHMWCKTCYQPVESEFEEDHSCDGSKELEKLMKAQGWKNCPGCQTPTARTHGCNHMTCGAPGCNTHFCYVDGAFICRAQNNGVAKEAVDAHYRACKLFDVPGE